MKGLAKWREGREDGKKRSRVRRGEIGWEDEGERKERGWG